VEHYVISLGTNLNSLTVKICSKFVLRLATNLLTVIDIRMLQVCNGYAIRTDIEIILIGSCIIVAPDLFGAWYRRSDTWYLRPNFFTKTQLFVQK
jgi:hypothetical protein